MALAEQPVTLEESSDMYDDDIDEMRELLEITLARIAELELIIASIEIFCIIIESCIF